MTGMSSFPSERQSSRDAARGWRGPWSSFSRRWTPACDQEDEVRERLYAKPPPAERTVEVLGPVARRIADRPAA